MLLSDFETKHKKGFCFSKFSYLNGDNMKTSSI